MAALADPATLGTRAWMARVHRNLTIVGLAVADRQCSRTGLPSVWRPCESWKGHQWLLAAPLGGLTSDQPIRPQYEMTDKIKAVPLLSAEELSVLNKVLSHFITAKREVPHFLFKVQPSLLIDPNSIESAKAKIRTICFMGCITIAIAFKYERANVRAVVIDAKETWATEMKDLLEQYDIDVLVCNLVNDVVDVIRFVDNAWAQRFRPRDKVVRPVTNPQEAWFKRLCDRAIGHVMRAKDHRLSSAEKVSDNIGRALATPPQGQYMIFREPSLASIVEVNDACDKEAKYARKSRVDLMITGPVPTLMPLLVIEIDGDHHEELNQKNNDNIKNKLLVAANVPLVRLALKDVPFWVGAKKQIVSIAERRNAIRFEQLVVVLLNTLIRILDTERIDIPREFSEYRNVQLTEYLKRVHEYQKNNLTTVLPRDVEDKLWEESLDKYEESLIETQAKVYFRSMLWKWELTADLPRDWFKKHGYDISDLYSAVDENGFAYAVCAITSQQGSSQFCSPKVRLQYFGSGMENLGVGFKDVLHGALTNYVCMEARNYFKAE